MSLRESRNRAMSPTAARNVAAAITLTPGTGHQALRFGPVEHLLGDGPLGVLDLGLEKIDLPQRRGERLGFFDRETLLQLPEPTAALDPNMSEHVRPPPAGSGPPTAWRPPTPRLRPPSPPGRSAQGSQPAPRSRLRSSTRDHHHTSDPTRGSRSRRNRDADQGRSREMLRPVRKRERDHPRSALLKKCSTQRLGRDLCVGQSGSVPSPTARGWTLHPRWMHADVMGKLWVPVLVRLEESSSDHSPDHHLHPILHRRSGRHRRTSRIRHRPRQAVANPDPAPPPGADRAPQQADKQGALTPYRCRWAKRAVVRATFRAKAWEHPFPPVGRKQAGRC